MANNLLAAIQTAIAKHQAGDLQTAEQMYRSILSQTPRDAGVVDLLGVALLQQNKLQEAEEKIRYALKLNPLEATFHFHQGNIAQALGNSEQAQGCYRSALKLKPYYPEATQKLFNLLEAQGQHEAAARLCREAIRLNPRDTNALFTLARLCEHQGAWADAEALCQQILALQPTHRDAQLLHAKALQNHASLLLAEEQYEASAAAYRRLLEIDPTDFSAVHMLAAIENDRAQRDAQDRTRAWFDRHADNYEQHWQHEMGYIIPTKMHALLARTNPPKQYEILDLGCGTGLSGLAIRSLASRLVGVDLSSGMLELARAKEIYTELCCEELLAYLERTPDAAFDLVVSADVFAYVGDLSAVFAEVARVLRNDGLFVFSIPESTAHHTPENELGYAGHHTCSADQLHALIRQQDFRPLHFSQETIRSDQGKPVSGHLVMLQKNAHNSSACSAEQIDQAVHEILSDRYANAASIQGWLFSTIIDHRFFDGQLKRLPAQRHPTQLKTCPESADITQAASAHLERIHQIDGVAAKWAALEELTQLNTPSLTQDSFAGLTEAECRQALRQCFPEDKLNVVIIGAGPAGLALASALKLALHANINVLVVEDRVSAPHHKLPYERRWVTNITFTFLQHLAEKQVNEILAGISDGTHIGCTVNVLESLLLLSCRRLGVKFCFDASGDFSFIQNSPVQFVFDASGGRLQPPVWPSSANEIAVRHLIETACLHCDATSISYYGIGLHPCADNRQIALGSYDKLFFPLYKNQPIKLAMLKLIDIPSRYYGALLNYISQHNEDNKYYVWPATLHEAINQLIVIINLDKKEYDYLCDRHVFPLNPAEALRTEAFRAILDKRTCAILELLTQEADKHEQTSIDSPFMFDPRLTDNALPEYLYGRPLIRVGDSVYNGNVKFGNGLGLHLKNVLHIQTVLKNNFTAQ